MPSKQSRSNASRRNYLAGVATSVASLAVVPITTARGTDPREILEQGLQIRDQAQSREPFEKFILNRGFSKVFQNDIQHNNAPVGYNTGDGVSTLDAEKNDFILGLSCYSDVQTGSTYLDGQIEVTLSSSDGDPGDDECGGPPEDEFSVQWEHSDYDIVWDSWYSGGDTSKRKATTNGVAFDWEESTPLTGECADGDSTLLYTYGSVEITPDPGTVVTERGGFLNYYHTWSSGSIDSVTIGTNGSLGITLGWDAKAWDSPLQAYDAE